MWMPEKASGVADCEGRAISSLRSGAVERRPQAEAFAQLRLGELAAYLQGREYLEERFSVGDLMMATVLRIPRHTALITADPVLGPYLARCECRAAFQRALAEQLADFVPWESRAVSAA